MTLPSQEDASRACFLPALSLTTESSLFSHARTECVIFEKLLTKQNNALVLAILTSRVILLVVTGLCKDDETDVGVILFCTHNQRVQNINLGNPPLRHIFPNLHLDLALVGHVPEHFCLQVLKHLSFGIFDSRIRCHA